MFDAWAKWRTVRRHTSQLDPAASLPPAVNCTSCCRAPSPGARDIDCSPSSVEPKTWALARAGRAKRDWLREGWWRWWQWWGRSGARLASLAAGARPPPD